MADEDGDMEAVEDVDLDDVDGVESCDEEGCGGSGDNDRAAVGGTPAPGSLLRNDSDSGIFNEADSGGLELRAPESERGGGAYLGGECT